MYEVYNLLLQCDILYTYTVGVYPWCYLRCL